MTVASLALSPSHPSIITPKSIENTPTGSSVDENSTPSASSTTLPTATATPPPYLFKPIWDYDRFPVEPCFRERHHRSQEYQNPFYIDYTQQHDRPQAISPGQGGNDMIRSHSSPSLSATILVPKSHGHYASQHSSRRGSRYEIQYDTSNNSSNQNIGILGTTLICPHFSMDTNMSTTGTGPTIMNTNMNSNAAQMERLHSSISSSSFSSSTNLSSSSSPTTLKPSTTGADTLSAKLTAPSTPCINIKKSNGLVPKFFKKTRMVVNRKKSIPSHSRQPLHQYQDAQASSHSLLDHEQEASSLTYFGLDTEKGESALDTSSMAATVSPAGMSNGIDQTRYPLEEQHDRWRDEWLRRSGAIHSMFRDRPSKFNCPHCGAFKVVSHIQFVPGVMSYLVAFGLVFLTLGTLSYLPFRKDHEGTKDCIHWCPECGQRVARFLRANATWEWI
ncbi:hypothetical protein BGZ65_011676 [Modicella reniformis]|uniref:LITAF domain-containing protein n=1 Tax=Modicella reniformis TaxID=1440133 RepID=A0A9P6IMM4_9FUNG|nr:hypothetical protein BGZ65_011676 [Modicella reniformis]